MDTLRLLVPTKELAPHFWFLTLPAQKLPSWSAAQLQEGVLSSTTSFLC